MDSYYPLYVKSGDTLTVVCQSHERATIEWVQKTVSTNWRAVAVNITTGGDISIESCTTEPSGFSKSTLSRSNMNLNTRGMYQCKDADESSSYAIWVTVLYSMFISFALLQTCGLLKLFFISCWLRLLCVFLLQI